MKFLGLDVGEKRIGVAKADSGVKIAVPVSTIEADGTELDQIVKLVKLNGIDVIVVGMPRNLNGEMTKQSLYVKDFASRLNKHLVEALPNQKPVRILFQDESLTSVEAKNNLKNKKGGFSKKAGDVDKEAATLILQDFIENLSRRIAEKNSQKTATPDAENTPKETKLQSSPSSSKENAPGREKQQFKPYKKSSLKKWLIIRIFIIILLVAGLGFLGCKIWYDSSLTARIDKKSCESADAESELCKTIDFEIADGMSVDEIATSLKSNDLIKSSLAFKIYLRLTGQAKDLKSGTYKLSRTSGVEDLTKQFIEGTSTALVFRFTTLPGETLKDIKSRLKTVGYSEEEIEAAFTKEYSHPVLVDKPKDASLEGYLFGETYEFYRSDSVETIISRMLDELYKVVERNNLKTKYNALGLSLHQGIILASLVQKEAGNLPKEDQAKVAQVFLSRLDNGIPLGSDVTVSYAVDLVDPERKVYTDNASALNIDSCYNTRKNLGLPCGPISNPGSLALLAVASPADTSYLYFLTGDDGSMYYSNTESEHIQKINLYCKELCNVQL